jgi:hypothetical protein
MASDPGDLRSEAENRVRLRFDRQTAELTEWQRSERQRDARLQSQAIEHSKARQTILESDKENALAEHDRAWDQVKGRLTPRPSPAPAFDMIGTPPNRNVTQHHDEMRKRWTERRDEIVKDFDKDLADCEAARAEMQEGFARANQARDQAYGEDRARLAERQQQSFEGLVQKELDRADRWTSREFRERSRGDNERDL